MKKYKMSGFREPMAEEEVNEMYCCNYCNDVLINYGMVRKDWQLVETQYGHYCCEKEECIWEYIMDHSGIDAGDEIEETIEVCENCEEKEPVKDGDLCTECEQEV